MPLQAGRPTVEPAVWLTNVELWLQSLKRVPDCGEVAEGDQGVRVLSPSTRLLDA
jgi:hypothetical protein